MTKTPTQTYRFQVSGSVGTAAWHIDLPYFTDEAALEAAKDLALQFVGMRGFMGLAVFHMTSATDGDHIGTVRINEPTTTLTLAKAGR